ncbi:MULTISPECIES: hypothetical protein [Acidianus]|uniref:hypothetical protein n=1 Tax=Acidianus TaxID=12914 RepID=UPI0006937BB4|nr:MULTISPECIES: hypothetical protein [Acidianus]NON62034.1 hypothetical protein [Acidianus sp. RZ1]
MEISPEKILNYLIFVGIWYLLLFIYIIWKRSFKYKIEDCQFTIQSPLSRPIKLSCNEIKENFVSQGFLAKKFGCASLYLITEKNTYIIKDVDERVAREGEKLLEEKK